MKECPSCRRCYEDRSNFCPIDGVGLTYGISGPRLLAGKYRLERLIARGGMGAIYQAIQEGLERMIAIKVLNPELVHNQTVLERFRREALTAASLKHPNIVTIYDFGVTPSGSPFIAMEYLKGRSLSLIIEQEGKLSVDRMLAITDPICHALAEAHAKGIIHRDLKPDNIMLEQSGSTEIVKVVDFGLAKLKQSAEQRRITGNLVVGTFDYMSPEQCQALELDATSDIYSLGVVIYEMLTGRVPFQGKSRLATIYQHINEQPRPPRELVPELSAEVERVVLKALSKEPAKRQKTALDLIGELHEATTQTELKLPARSGILRRDTGPISVLPPERHNVNINSALRKHLVFEHFIGREREIARLTTELAFIRSGRTRPLVILGDAGIGKSQLVTEFWRRQSAVPGANPAIFLSGRFFDYLGTTPYKPVLDTLTAVLKQYPSSVFDAIFGEMTERMRYDLAHDWPFRNGLRGDSGALQGGPEGEKYRIFEYLTQIYVRMARHTPVILWMDDLQWADGLSLNFLSYLLRRSLGEPIQFIFSARLQDVAQKNHPFQQWQTSVAESRSLEQIRLAGLSVQELEQYMHLVFGDIEIGTTEASKRKVLELLWSETQGNPYYLAEILRLLVEENRIIWDGQRWVCEPLESVGLPSSILNIVDAHLRRFRQEELDVFMQAAVLGEQFSFETLKLVTGIDEDHLIDILETGIAGYVFREGPAESPYAERRLPSSREEVYSFYQTTVRKVLYSKINSRRRRRLHLLVAEALESYNGDRLEQMTPLLAYHYMKGEQYQLAFKYSVEAADSAWVSLAVDEAEKHIANIDEITDKIPAIRKLEERARKSNENTESLLEEPLAIPLAKYRILLGELLTSRGRLQDAERALATGLRLSEQLHNVGIKGRAILATGELYREQNKHEQALKCFQHALSVYQQSGYASGECQAMNRLSWLHYVMADYQQAAELASRCVTLAEQTGNRLAVAGGQMIAAFTDYRTAKYSSAIECGRVVLEAAQIAGDKILEYQSAGLLGLCYTAVCAYDIASGWLHQALQTSRDTGASRAEAGLLIDLGSLHLKQGEFQEAIELFTRAYDVARSISAIREQKRALLHLGLVYKGLQYRDQAFGYLRQSWALSREVFDPILTIWESAGFAELYLSTGELDEAVALSQQALDLARRKGLRGEVWYLLYLRGRILKQTGDLEGAAKSLEDAIKTLKAIAGELSDPALKKSFLVDKSVVVEALNQLRNQRAQ